MDAGMDGRTRLKPETTKQNDHSPAISSSTISKSLPLPALIDQTSEIQMMFHLSSCLPAGCLKTGWKFSIISIYWTICISGFPRIYIIQKRYLNHLSDMGQRIGTITIPMLYFPKRQSRSCSICSCTTSTSQLPSEGDQNKSVKTSEHVLLRDL